MGTMRVGVVGTGMIVGMLVPRFAEHGMEVVAISGTPRSADRVRELAQTYGAKRHYIDWHELVRDPDVDVVYVGVSNHVHYAVAKEALLDNKDVLCEKPLCSNQAEAEELAALAKVRSRFLWEAVVTPHQPNFKLIKYELLPLIGDVRHVTVNFSQYSSRYNAFRSGEVAPVFDPARSGGALMDLGLYTLSFTLGLFGEPREARYLPHIERGIDTSGTMVLSYDDFCAINICAKDSNGPNQAFIEGIDGYVHVHTGPNFCGATTLVLNDGTQHTVDESLPNVYDGELRAFVAQWDRRDLAACYAQLEQSLLVSRVQHAMRRAAGIVFPTDE